MNANLSFIVIDVGAYGIESDPNIFKECPLGKKLYFSRINIPEPSYLLNTQNAVFVADKLFTLYKNILRTYPERVLTGKCRIFNYRLPRARRNVECAFEVLSNKWRVSHTTPLLVEPDCSNEVIQTCGILHNIVRPKDGINFDDVATNQLVDDLDVGNSNTE